jgi:hypothetical protein
VVFTSACKECFGGVLLRDKKKNYYESRKLEKQKKNYPTNNLQLNAITHALKMRHHYLMGRIFLLMLDNINLQYLFNQQNLNARQARWLSF